MPFEVEDLRDLIRLLQQHPEWQEELGRYVLSRELLALPAEVRDLRAEMERSFRELARRLDELTEITRAHATRLDTIDARLDRLADTVSELTEITRAHASRLDELTEITRAQAASLRELTEITRAHANRLDTIDERLDRLAASVAELVEVTRDHANRLARLERDGRATRQQLGALSTLVGARAESDAARVLMEMLRSKGYEVTGLPRSLSVDGEIDVAVPVRDPSGQETWILVEAKARLRQSDIREWARKLRQSDFRARIRAAGVREPVKAYAFGLMFYQHTDTAAREHGIGLLTPFGEVVEPA